MIRDGFITVGRAFTARLARRKAAPYVGEGGFTLIEVMICTLILTTGMLGIAGLLGVTTFMQVDAREASRSTRIAQDKIDELMKLDLAADAAVQEGGSLSSNVTNYFEVPTDIDDVPIEGVTVRWFVDEGPVDDTRVLTVHVENFRARQYGRNVELSTIIRQW